MPPPQGTWNPLEGPGDYTTTRTVHSDTYDAIDPLKANLTSKTVFISGASRGLGKAMALSFAKAGASQIAISARSGLEPVAADMKKAATDAGRKEPEVLTLEVEVSSPDSVSKAVEKIGATFLKLDIVINNAGVIGEMKAVADSDPEAWWNTSKSLLARHRCLYFYCTDVA